MDINETLILIVIILILSIVILYPLYQWWQSLSTYDCNKFGNPVLPGCPSDKVGIEELCYVNSFEANHYHHLSLSE